MRSKRWEIVEGDVTTEVGVDNICGRAAESRRVGVGDVGVEVGEIL